MFNLSSERKNQVSFSDEDVNQLQQTKTVQLPLTALEFMR